ncbi:MAG: hypothetical protein LBE18_00020 [Planctomycetaceae bacterium]|jgi:hypothetical protein|nr:hypothetical protein [Planctomycetaceae bacterium]
MSKKKNSFSPFTIFRRNQVAGLSALGMLAMIAFIILPAIMQMSPGYRNGDELRNIATTRHHGKVDDILLDNLRRNSENLARFYQRILIVIIQANPSILSSQEQLARLGLLEMKANQLTQIRDEELINNWLIARYAEDIGIKINTDTILDQLKADTNNLITRQNLNQVIEDLNFNEQYLIQLIAEEIRQRQVTYLFFITQNTILPSTRWEWFKRLNKQMSLEVATLPVEAFIDKVPEPTVAQITQFFDENKKRQFDPTKPEIGFTYPKQVSFSYIKGTPSQKLLDSISKQDIEKYYEENKEKSFRKPVTPPNNAVNTPNKNQDNFKFDVNLPRLPTTNLGGIENIIPNLKINTDIDPNTTPTTTNLTTPIPDQTTKEQKENTTEITPTPNSTTPEITTPEIKTPETKTPETPTPENKTPETTTPINKSETNTENNEKVEKDKEINLVQNFRSSVQTLFGVNSVTGSVKLVSFQNEPSSDEIKEPTTNQPAEQVEKKIIENDKNTNSQTDTKIDDKKVDDTKVDDAKVVDTKVDTQPNSNTEKSDGDNTDIDNILYKPLSEVENDIRRYLASVKIDKAFDEIETKLREHYDVYRKYVDRQLEHPQLALQKPTPPDFSTIVEPVDLEIVSEELGTIFDVMRHSDFVRGETERKFIIDWFNGRPYEYQANKIGNEYQRILVWATDFKDSVEPKSIDDNITLRDTVIKRWKEVQAREIAFKTAKELTELAKGSKEPLNVSLASKSDLAKITETEPFTWLTFGYSIDWNSPVRLGEIREKGVLYGESELSNKYIHAPGEEFMKAASKLEIGGIDTVFNQPKTSVYIIRLINTSPAENALWELFKTAPAQLYLQIGQRDRLIESRESWLESIRSEMDFKWINKPKEDE